MKRQNHTTTMYRRVLSAILATLMVLTMVPTGLFGAAVVAASTGITTVADPETLTRPETIYGDNTVNTGKVTVGKSVSDTDVTVKVTLQEPARVVYAVGLWDGINAQTVSSIVASDYVQETVNGEGSVNYDPATDTYYFFTKTC